jgi:hypothetical protein
VPREALPNGDVIEGHYVELGAKNATDEVVQPAAHIPRAPRNTPVPLKEKVRAPKPAPPMEPPAYPPPQSMAPAPQLPIGIAINPQGGGHVAP